MSKPRDPVLAVIRYFETADLPLAQQALAIARGIVKRRVPRLASTLARPKAKVKSQPANGPAAAEPVVRG